MTGAVRQRLGRPRGYREFGWGYADRIASHVLNRLAQSSVILPTQINRRALADGAELKLLRCILLSAIADIIAGIERGSAARERRDNAAIAWRWIAGAPGAPIDFEMACSAVGWSSEAMRERIAALARRPRPPQPALGTSVIGTKPKVGSSLAHGT